VDEDNGEIRGKYWIPSLEFEGRVKDIPSMQNGLDGGFGEL